MDKKQLQKARSLYVEKKAKYDFDSLGKGFVAEDEVSLYKLEQEAIQEASIVTKKSRVKERKQDFTKKEDKVQKQRIDFKELKKKGKLQKKDAKNVVFEYSLIGSIFNQVSIIDKLIMLILEKMKDKGELEQLAMKNEIMVNEDKQRHYANCYSFLNYVIKGLHKKNDVIRFKLDSKFVASAKEIIELPKFSRYAFTFIHQSIIDEPSIMEVSFK